MKKNIKFFLAITVIVFTFGGCGFGMYKTGFETTGGFKEERVYSLLATHESAIDIARAQQISSQADINRAIAKNIENNIGAATAAGGSYIGIIANDNVRKNAYVRHPYFDQTIEIPPGQSRPIIAPLVPKYVMARFSGDEKFVKHKIFQKSTVYNGVKVDFGTRVY